MEAYTDFASVYDTFMDETPYEEWSEYLTKILKKNCIEDGLLLELGCGTGSMTEIMSRKGFDMIGIDLSTEMLSIAMEKKEKTKSDILYLCQDMCDFELYGTVRAVYSVCDSVNYLLETEDMIQMMKLVNNYLDPKGIFVFDFNTVYKYREVIGDTTIAEDREECSFIWDNFYHEENHINEYELTIFVKQTEEQGEELYRKFQESHYQRGYTLEEMKQFATEAGMDFVEAYDAYTGKKVSADSERILLVLRENGKK